jgi:hypothetical protein
MSGRISGYPALPDIRPDIWQGNLVSGWIPDIEKGRIIRPDIRRIPNYFTQNLQHYKPVCFMFSGQCDGAFSCGLFR